jgi:hypothetical protein
MMPPTCTVERQTTLQFSSLYANIDDPSLNKEIHKDIVILDLFISVECGYYLCCNASRTQISACQFLVTFHSSDTSGSYHDKLIPQFYRNSFTLFELPSLVFTGKPWVQNSTPCTDLPLLGITL